jgi:hypothetical protein
MMNFSQAVNNMTAGQRLIRAGWGGFYLAILPNQAYIWTIGTSKTPAVNATIYTPSVEDIQATDWMLTTN